jgi:hypothetical protein
VAEIKEKELNPDSEFDYENTNTVHIIDADPTAIIATTKIQPEEPTYFEEGERLFSFTDVREGDPIAFIVDNGS